MMKTLFTLITCITAVTTSFAQGYKVTLQTPNFKSGIAYLTYHMGKNLNIEDSAAINNEGLAVFKGTKTLPGGIYSVVFPGKSLTADFFIDKEQNIQIKADTADLKNIVVSGSKENILFQQYQKFVADKGKLMQQERAAYNGSATKTDSLLHEENYNRYNTELNNYRTGIISNQPKSMMAALLNAMKEPPYPSKKPVTRQDSIDNYNFYKAHYWDGITFMDERVIRTPFFLPKVEKYYREVISQSPDSIIKDVDYKLLLARSAPEMYKFLINWLTDEYINPKYMGQDAVFVHLFNKYHSKGLSSWLNEKQMETISRRAYMQMSNLIGENAANLEMLDSTGKPTALYDLKADYTLVIFWDPTCGHCKEELPKIDSIYRASWKEKNLKIYAVLSEDQKPEWVKYIKAHDLGDWTHVYQTKEMAKAEADAQRASYRQLYDVITTPTLYLLDKEKRIIGKKLSWQQLNDLLLVKLNGKTKP
jgi:thiol-disulfide isomerase/thioredoxin